MLALDMLRGAADAGAQPTLDLNFASGTLDSRVTYSRASSATRVNASGVLEVITSGNPRFTYDPVTLNALGLLIEEQRTNLLPWSRDFSNAAWTKQASGCTAVRNAVGVDGVAASACTVTEGSTLVPRSVYQGVSGLSGVYSQSAYFSQTAGPTRYMRVVIASSANDFGYVTVNMTTGAIVQAAGAVGTASAASASASSQPATGLWKVTLTCTLAAPLTFMFLVPLASYTTVTPGDYGRDQYLGDGTTNWVWDAAQLEAGAFATSYIPTTSASVTRAADSATMTGSNFSSWYNSTQGTLVVNAISNSIGTNNEGTATIYQDATNTIGVGRRYAGGGLTTISLFVYTGGATQAYAQSGTISVGAPYKSAARYAANDFAISVNGDAPTTDVAGTPPSSPTSLLIGRTYANEYSSGPIARLRYYPVALTNAQLQALTT